jgi:hypothetical protein
MLDNQMQLSDEEIGVSKAIDAMNLASPKFPTLSFDLQFENGVPNIFIYYNPGDYAVARQAFDFLMFERDENPYEHFVVDLYGEGS